jgi:hypothetical protein
LGELILPRGAGFAASFRKEVLGGVVVLDASAERAKPSEWERTLYQPLPKGERTTLRLVPYGFWDNRKAGAMQVWFPYAPPTPRVFGPEGKAEVSLSFRSGNAQPWGINDGIEPKSSGEQPSALCHFWPHKGGEEWVQYTWKKPLTVTGVKVYWFDDTGRGECRLPESWKLQALAGTEWKDVVPAESPSESLITNRSFPIALDRWSEVSFPAVTTTALRVVVRQKPGWASGIHEWKVVADD